MKAALNLQMSLEHSKELSDCKQLIKTLVMGMNTLFWSISHVNVVQMQVSQPSSDDIPFGFQCMREYQVWLASGVLKSGVHFLSIFKDKEEERYVATFFYFFFPVMEHRNLMKIFSMCI